LLGTEVLLPNATDEVRVEIGAWYALALAS
jgi:hypothetical protein